MSVNKGKTTITIDNKPYEVEAGKTILQVTEENGIYIPTLCAHKELSPHGGCRMCIVEVEGFRNFPTACTTPVSDGMVIRTDTAALNSIRKEILQLFMSEHTSSCLICPESEECRQWMGTVRKAGVTTGCRYCPNDGQCEFQDVVTKMGIDEIKYPIYYRNNPVEKTDPFYDRDYNLCVLCGRCVRMCQEIRTANVLAFNFKGRETVIGPSFGRSHLEAGCEFCGACVSVCPTGALSEKDRKWEGKPEREEISTCSFCGVGCQLRLLVKEDRIIGSLPVVGDVVNDGQLCVRGRFCISEVVNGHQRLQLPRKSINGIDVDVSWDEAVAIAVEKLTACNPDEIGVMISPNLTNEDLYVAQKFSRVALKSNNIDTPARSFYGPGFGAYIDLLKDAAPLSDVRKASVILAIGLDSRFGRSVVGVELRRAAQRGAKILTIHPRDHSLSLIAEKWIQPAPDETAKTLEKLSQLVGKKSDPSDDLGQIAKMLTDAKDALILTGSEFLQFDDSARILELVRKIAKRTKAGILPLPAQNNLVGSLMMGAYRELLPGGISLNDKKGMTALQKLWGAGLPPLTSVKSKSGNSNGRRLKVLYLIGETPADQKLPEADFIISQNLYPAESGRGVNLDLAAAAFTEVDGTFINGEGRVQRVRKAVEPKGQALPDWKILCLIAKGMGVPGFDFKSAADVFKEIGKLMPGFKNFNEPARKVQPLILNGKVQMNGAGSTKAGSNGKAPFVLSACTVEHVHRGMPLSTWVDGSRAIFREGVIDINPIDARKKKLSDGDEIVVTSGKFKRVWPVRLEQKQPQGTLFVVLPQGDSFNANPRPVNIRKKHV